MGAGGNPRLARKVHSPERHARLLPGGEEAEGDLFARVEAPAADLSGLRDRGLIRSQER